MIFVTLGTQDKSFDRLLDAIQDQIDKGNITEEVVVQSGYTKYKSDNMKLFKLIPKEEFENLMKNCDLLITHGGVSSILTGLKNNKKIIAAPRLKKYGEHTNDHQIQIVNRFSDSGYILKLENFSHLDVLLKKVKQFKPKKYISNTKNMITIIEKFIDSKDGNHY